MGNRGCLHDDRTVVRHHRGKRWIICEPDYKGWRAAQWAPGRYTVLFFHDEAVAFAAGHRPCALCRHPAFEAYRGAVGRPPAPTLDERLQEERWNGAQQRVHRRRWADLPVGTFVVLDDRPALVGTEVVVPWTTRGYGTARSRPSRGSATVLTPPTSVDVLAAGYALQVAPDAGVTD